MKPLTKWVVLVSVIMMTGTFVFPLWKITLNAPQYPEGLEMKIGSTGVSGNVDQINDLNHYIGMKKITSDEFTEFKLLPYVMGGLILLGLAAYFLNRRSVLYVWIIAILVLGIVGIIDFYHWEYLYGHQLDPKAAIKVPGMAYQPPMIGYEQLLNFLAGAFPGIGGYCIILPGVSLFSVGLYEFFSHSKYHLLKRFNKHHHALAD